MRSGDRAEFALGFRERHIEALLAPGCAFQQELQGDRGLARSGAAFQQERAPAREPAAEYVVETRNAREGARC